MYLTRLSLTDYRTFSRLDLDLPKRIIVLVGANAQGKTSILESIYYLATFSSFNTSQDRQLINFNSPKSSINIARIVSEFQTKFKKHILEIRLIQESNGANSPLRFRKEILLDGIKKRPGDVIGIFNAVIFLPQMARIIEGSPVDRRGYIDSLLSQIIPHYARDLTDYDKAITQRNALLKILGEQGGDEKQLEVWDELIARFGSSIIIKRISALQELEQLAKRIHLKLTDDKEILRLSYQPSFDPLPKPKGQMLLPVDTDTDRSHLSLPEIQSGFLKALHASYREDIVRGVTILGPHRDELRFLSNQVDLGDFGSRGQTRTTLLSMKLAEVQWMHSKTGEWPILLLDEIMSELDPIRRDAVLMALQNVEQALLTSTDPDMFAKNFLDSHEIWHIENGMVLK